MKSYSVVLVALLASIIIDSGAARKERVGHD